MPLLANHEDSSRYTAPPDVPNFYDEGYNAVMHKYLEDEANFDDQSIGNPFSYAPNSPEFISFSEGRMNALFHIEKLQS